MGISWNSNVDIRNVVQNSLQESFWTPLEAKYWHLLINHFNNELREVKGKVDRFAEINRKTIFDDYSYENVKSIEK